MSDSANVMTVGSSLGPQSTNRPTDLLLIDGQLTFICALMDARCHEVTKRMAACWNALNGVPLNEIESAAQSGSISHALQKVISQRDELIEAMADLLHNSAPPYSGNCAADKDFERRYREVSTRCLSFIAKANGGINV
jgi:hypothetical protein